jgi:hypothetical protein
MFSKELAGKKKEHVMAIIKIIMALCQPVMPLSLSEVSWRGELGVI